MNENRHSPLQLDRTADTLLEGAIASTKVAQDRQARAEAGERSARAAQVQAEGNQAFAEAAQYVAEQRATTLDAAVTLRDNLLAFASHDLRTPLTALMGQAQLQQQRLDKGQVPTAGQLRDWLTLVSHLLQRELAIVAEVGDAVALQMQGQLRLHIEEIDVCALANEAAQAVSGGHRDRIQIIEMNEPRPVQGDRARLMRVLENIIGNALKFSAPETGVSVCIACSPRDCTIVVRDDGVGIPADEIAQLFTPFNRASTARDVVGTGLGLSGAQAIARQHGGNISVESVVGKGTTVTLTLPQTPDQRLGPHEMIL